MKRSHHAAQYGGAIRLSNQTDSELVVRPELARLWSITVQASNIVDVVLPITQTEHIREGAQIRVVNRGIGGTGNLRFILKTAPVYWDFVARDWVESPGADCLIAPGYFATAIYYTGGDFPYVCFRKTATPAAIL